MHSSSIPVRVHLSVTMDDHIDLGLYLWTHLSVTMDDHIDLGLYLWIHLAVWSVQPFRAPAPGGDVGGTRGRGALYVLLRGANGRYLGGPDASKRWPLSSCRRHAAQRDFDEPEVEAIMWRAVGTGAGRDVLLLHDKFGRFLRTYARYVSCCAAVAVDDCSDLSKTMHWAVEPVPRQLGRPEVPIAAMELDRRYVSWLRVAFSADAEMESSFMPEKPEIVWTQCANFHDIRGYCDDPSTARYNDLYCDAIRCAKEGSISSELYNIAKEALHKALDEWNLFLVLWKYVLAVFLYGEESATEVMARAQKEEGQSQDGSRMKAICQDQNGSIAKHPEA
ncbi:hypothetical protein ABZP36_028845 [Zizania latifolia]